LPDWLLPDKGRESATLSAEPECRSQAAGSSAQELMLMKQPLQYNTLPDCNWKAYFPHNFHMHPGLHIHR
jgi:hypothetical protein